MEITRNVILDLLPLYAANEVSADTRTLVEKYLETDPELANVANQLDDIEKPEKIPVPLSRDDEMMAYKKARMIKFLITIILAGVLSVFLVITLVVFFLSSS
jgi:hypothetical protein